jgi:hypothetical protein
LNGERNSPGWDSQRSIEVKLCGFMLRIITSI